MDSESLLPVVEAFELSDVMTLVALDDRDFVLLFRSLAGIMELVGRGREAERRSDSEWEGGKYKVQIGRAHV